MNLSVGLAAKRGAPAIRSVLRIFDPARASRFESVSTSIMPLEASITQGPGGPCGPARASSSTRWLNSSQLNSRLMKNEGSERSIEGESIVEPSRPSARERGSRCP